MQHLSNKITILYFSIFIVGFIAWQSQANRRFALLEPAVFVSVDIEHIFEALEERVYEQTRVQTIADEMGKELEAKRQHIESYEQEFELYQPGSSKWNELMQEKQLAVLEYRAQVEYTQSRTVREESRGLRRVYEQIKLAAEELSIQQGWDYVVVNDAAVAIRDNVDMHAQLSSRRMLYANSALDVTDIVIEYMNADFDEMAVR